VFLVSNDYEGVRSSLSIFTKWIDDHNLLVAAPEGSNLRTMRNEFDDVHIQYAFYPIDSDKTKDQKLRRQMEKKVRFEPEFSMDHGIGVPGIGCHLTASARDKEYFDNLSLHLTARTTFAINANDRGKIVLNEAYSTYDFQLTARDEIERPDKHVTGADVVGFAPKDGKSKLWARDLNYPGVRAPNGLPMPKWYFAFNPTDPHDIVSISNKIEAGDISVQLSYWLDNNVVVYSAEKPTDKAPIKDFVRCVNENHIFDTPRHKTDHD
jgi:hypothetical protein